ncbi:MAG: YbaB/EbfC family nucleoid-associated protein [Phycisphaerae bacterium]
MPRIFRHGWPPFRKKSSGCVSTRRPAVGRVRVTLDGKFHMVDLKIEPSAMEDRELLEDLIMSAVNAAATRAKEAMKAELSKVTGGINIPGLSMLP